jgi:hypothetical protein
MTFKKWGIKIEEINLNSFMEPSLIQQKIKYALIFKIRGIAIEEINANSLIQTKLYSQ